MSNEREQTIPFLPNRLNREATVFGGMTMTEFFVTAIIGFIIGALLGLLIVLLLALYLHHFNRQKPHCPLKTRQTGWLFEPST